MKVFKEDSYDLMRKSKTYREILKHRKNCKKWGKGFCLDCFGGGLTLFLGKIREEFIKTSKSEEKE